MADLTYQKTKLEHLTDFITNALKNAVLENRIDAWQENATLIPNGECRGNGGIRIAHWQYSAVVHIEGFPHHQIDPRYLLAAIGCWLSEHDPNRQDFELSDPSLSIDVLDDGTVDVALEIDLIECIEMIPDENGLIEFNGETYRVETTGIDWAESMEIENE